MTGRLLGMLAVMFLTSGIGSAQDGLRSASLPERTPQNPIPAPPVDIYRVPSDTWSPRPPLPHFPRGPRYPIYGYGPYLVPPAEPRDVLRYDELRTGYLYLQMQPGNAQVSIDGYYMGSVDDFRRLIPGRSLPAGAHRVEVRAPGYEPATFDVMIAPNETVTYRTDLRRDDPAPPAAAAVPPALPKTFYVIPGCYAGDKPPAGRLPRGCDRSKVRVIPPASSLVAKR